MEFTSNEGRLYAVLLTDCAMINWTVNDSPGCIHRRAYALVFVEPP